MNSETPINPIPDALITMAASTSEATDGQKCGLVAIVGRPNVGKSTLINALVGQKISITSRKAQTTRHRITGVRTREKTQYVFVDTPGYQTEYSAALNKSLNKTVVGAVSDASASLTVFAPTDAAFAQLPAPFNTAANITAIADGAQIDFLRNVLLYHVVGQELLSPKVPVGRTALPTLKPQVNGNDNTIYVSKAFNVIKVNGQTEVIMANVDATNGVIHVINDVLLPPTKTIAAVFGSIVFACTSCLVVCFFWNVISS